jgi:hypothetical protein
MKLVAVNWYDERLDEYYGHDNQGFVYGIYRYDTGEDFATDVAWYKTEEERDNQIGKGKRYEAHYRHRHDRQFT